MANTVNVTTANTFEEWRVKTNELGTKIGDLDKVTNSDIGATTIVAAVEAHQTIVASSLASTGNPSFFLFFNVIFFTYFNNFIPFRHIS